MALIRAAACSVGVLIFRSCTGAFLGVDAVDPLLKPNKGDSERLLLGDDVSLAGNCSITGCGKYLYLRLSSSLLTPSLA